MSVIQVSGIQLTNPCPSAVFSIKLYKRLFPFLDSGFNVMHLLKTVCLKCFIKLMINYLCICMVILNLFAA